MIVVITCCHVASVISQRNGQQRNTDHVSPRDIPRIFAALCSTRSVLCDDIKVSCDEMNVNAAVPEFVAITAFEKCKADGSLMHRGSIAASDHPVRRRRMNSFGVADDGCVQRSNGTSESAGATG
jgi:hypothetical protein